MMTLLFVPNKKKTILDICKCSPLSLTVTLGEGKIYNKIMWCGRTKQGPQIMCILKELGEIIILKYITIIFNKEKMTAISIAYFEGRFSNREYNLTIQLVTQSVLEAPCWQSVKHISNIPYSMLSGLYSCSLFSLPFSTFICFKVLPPCKASYYIRIIEMGCTIEVTQSTSTIQQMSTQPFLVKKKTPCHMAACSTSWQLDGLEVSLDV